MASVFERDGRWVVKWQDAAGRWRQQRTACATKAEAKRLASDLERKVERQEHGLEPLPTASAHKTFADLAEWWWKERGQQLASHATLRASLDLHLLPALGALPLVEVTAGKMDGALAATERTLSAKTVNNLRGLLMGIFSLAIRREEIPLLVNPVAKVPKRKVAKRLPTYLRAEEVPPVLAMLDPKWRGIFVCALYTGMRKGEILSLRKSDVDLDAGTLAVGRSWERSTTKGGHADLLPIANELKPFIEAAMKSSPSALVFPHPSGKMFRRDVPLDYVLRNALGRAGIVDRYDHRCRTKGCTHVEAAPDSTSRRCPTHKVKLWPKAVPRHVRFHDLRHTTATLLLKAGVPVATVQRILRHTDPRITTETYGHLDVDDMRMAVNRLPAGPSLFAVPTSPVSGRVRELGAPVVRTQEERSEGSNSKARNPGDFGTLEWRARRDLNPQPSGSKPDSGGMHDVGHSVTPSQTLERTGLTQSIGSDGLAAGGPVRTPFGAPVVRTNPASVDLSTLPERLLSVRAVAEILSVSRATVYALVERGELLHIRVSNSIRVRPEDLVFYLATQASGATPAAGGSGAS